MLGQRLAHRLLAALCRAFAFGRRLFRLGRLFGRLSALRLIEVLEEKIQLGDLGVELLGGLAEALAAKLGQLRA